MTTLIGREHEVRVLNGLVDAATKRGGSLLVRGEAGIGKSSLLAMAKELAEGLRFRVLTTIGVESEADLPFAGLHQLLRPVIHEVDGLPAPQRDAVLAAFGMADAVTPAPFLTALAALHLLGDVSARTPLLLIADDAQWLDRPSADVLAFVARRLESDQIVLIAAVRDGFENALVEAGLPELRLEGLDRVAAAALLDAQPMRLTGVVRERLLSDAAGNPLALTELPAALRHAGVAGAAWPPEWLPLTSRLERAFTDRVSGLPPTTRALLLVASVDDGGVLSEVLEATTMIIGIPATLDAVAPAVAAGLVEARETGLRFRHPLMRSAIHQAAGLTERQAAHAALATVLSHDLDRRAWHRAASVVGTDDEAASELEAVAERARRRGGSTVALAALERAAQLSVGPARRGGCLLRAAEVAFELGRHADAVRLLRQADPLELGPMKSPRLAWLREQFEDGAWTGAAKVRAFVDIADQMRLDGDTDRALNALMTVALRCYWSNPDAETRGLMVEAAERIPVPEDYPELIAVLAMSSPVERGAIVIDRLARLSPDAGGDPEDLHLLGTAATAVGAFELAVGFLEASVAGLRAQGRLGLLAQALVSQAWAGLLVGRWDVARRAAEEAGRLAHETSQPLWVVVARLAEAALAAYRGDSHVAEALADDAERVLLPIGANPMLAQVQLVRGAAALADGRHADAYEHLCRVFNPADTPYHPHVSAWVLADLTEAAVHSGHHEEAAGFVQALEPVAAQTRSPLMRVALSYVRPLLAGDDDAEALFLSGLGMELAGWPFCRARTQLAYGAWLRRHRRVVDSRGLLRAARDAFDALGAVPWGERARQELRATGEESRGWTPGASDRLTPQELHIAELASAGMSNKEIGAQLYLSHRTVGSHLYRAFPKLGITGRSQLSDALA